jgi:hypothetical protein
MTSLPRGRRRPRCTDETTPSTSTSSRTRWAPSSGDWKTTQRARLSLVKGVRAGRAEVRWRLQAPSGAPAQGRRVRVVGGCCSHGESKREVADRGAHRRGALGGGEAEAENRGEKRRLAVVENKVGRNFSSPSDVKIRPASTVHAAYGRCGNVATRGECGDGATTRVFKQWVRLTGGPSPFFEFSRVLIFQILKFKMVTLTLSKIHQTLHRVSWKHKEQLSFLSQFQIPSGL